MDSNLRVRRLTECYLPIQRDLFAHLFILYIQGYYKNGLNAEGILPDCSEKIRQVHIK